MSLYISLNLTWTAGFKEGNYLARKFIFPSILIISKIVLLIWSGRMDHVKGFQYPTHGLWYLNFSKTGIYGALLTLGIYFTELDPYHYYVLFSPFN